MELEPDHKKFLDDRFTKWVAVQPAASLLRDKLLHIGGCAIVPPPNNFESDLEALLKLGEDISGKVTLLEMEENSCHRNAAILWRESSDPNFGIGTGYALSKGLWRQHSWVITLHGLIETTEIRETYFGLRCYGRDAEMFSEMLSA